jgi:ankyrin repeat protein
VGTLTGTLDGEDNEAVETVTILLEHGADVNHADKEGMTPLLVAAFEGHRYARTLRI